MRLASYQVTIAAPAEVVWAHLTTAEGLVRWVGPEATADPTPVIEVRVVDRQIALALYDIDADTLTFSGVR